MRGTHRTLLGVWLAALAAGCGDIQKVSPDAGTDAAPGDDASQPGTATIEVHNVLDNANPGPLEDVPILFFGPDGELLAEQATDADGRASATIEPGSTAVVLMPQEGASGANEFYNFAIIGMQPGDEIALRENQSLGTFLGNMTVTLTTHPSASSYEVHGACSRNGNSSNTISMEAYSNCVGDQNAVEILAIARDGNNAVIGTYSTEVTFAAGSQIQAPGTWQAPDALEVRLVGMASVLGTAEIRAGWASGTQGFPVSLGNVELNGPETASSYPIAAGFGDSRVVELGLYPVQHASGYQTQMIRAALDDAEIEITGEDLLPWYTAPIYSSADRSLSWAATGGSEPDVLFAIVQWTEKGGGTYGLWYFIVPPEARSVVVPDLPEAHEARDIKNPDGVSGSLWAADLSSLDGYDEARQVGFEPAYERPALRLPAPSYSRQSISQGLSFRAAEGAGALDLPEEVRR